MTKRRWLLSTLVLFAAAAAATYVVFVYRAPRRSYNLDARARLAPYFKHAGVAYPPRRLAILAFKDERRLAVWAGDEKSWRFVRAYPILAASGHAGPKLREGDYQVPEGLYRIAYLNPASSYHLSMKVDYPNAFDRRQAALEHRTRLGGDIFIHGKNVSIGCIAIGDRAIEELFTLVGDTGLSRTRVIIAPADLRVTRPPMRADSPSWVATLYAGITKALADFPVWMESASAIDVRGRSKAMLVK